MYFNVVNCTKPINIINIYYFLSCFFMNFLHSFYIMDIPTFTISFRNNLVLYNIVLYSMLRQFKTNEHVPAPYAPDTKVLLGT